MVEIPPEITDRILDLLYNDHATLRSCSLVCKEWLPSSRFHIFDTLELPDLSTQHKFADLLESTPEIGGYLRTLDIKFLDKHPFICEQFSNLTTLTITTPDDFGPNFAALISCFPRLKHLALRHCFFATDDLPKSANFTGSIESLNLDNVQFSLVGFIDWAVAVDLFPNVHTFVYNNAFSQDQDGDRLGIRTFLAKCGSNLVNLTIFGLPSMYSEGESAPFRHF